MLLTVAEAGERRGCSRQTANNAIRSGKLFKNETGLIDDSDSRNSGWLNSRTAGGARTQKILKINKKNTDLVEDSDFPEILDFPEFSSDSESELIKEKYKAQTAHIKKQSRKLDLQHEKDLRNLILFDDVKMALGAFNSAIRTNILSVSDKVARGDTALRDRIDKEIKRSMEKTISTAQAEIDRILEKVVFNADDD